MSDMKDLRNKYQAAKNDAASLERKLTTAIGAEIASQRERLVRVERLLGEGQIDSAYSLLTGNGVHDTAVCPQAGADVGSRNLASRVSILLDDSAADNGNRRSQEKWISYWQDVKDGRVMASMGDLYVAFRDIRDKYEHGTEDEKSKAQTLLTSLREDSDWLRNSSLLVSGTRIFYSADSESSRITQHYGCNRSELVKETGLEIPVCRGTIITDVVADPKGLRYLQTLFDTEDSGEDIIQNMEFISGKDRSEIKVWTSPLSEGGIFTPRKAAGAGLVSGNDNFHINGNFSIYVLGHSRGVSISPR